MRVYISCLLLQYQLCGSQASTFDFRGTCVGDGNIIVFLTSVGLLYVHAYCSIQSVYRHNVLT